MNNIKKNIGIIGIIILVIIIIAIIITNNHKNNNTENEESELVGYWYIYSNGEKNENDYFYFEEDGTYIWHSLTYGEYLGIYSYEYKEKNDTFQKKLPKSTKYIEVVLNPEALTLNNGKIIYDNLKKTTYIIGLGRDDTIIEAYNTSTNNTINLKK